MRTWLIEVNTNPYLGIPNDFIRDLLPKMIDDMLDIAVDPLYPPKNKDTSRENNFELLYCESGSSFNNGQPKNVRSPFTKSLYPVSAFAQLPNKLVAKNSEDANNFTSIPAFLKKEVS